MAYAILHFDKMNSFVHITTLTTVDCEGSGEMLRVNTVIAPISLLKSKSIALPSESEDDSAKFLVNEKGERDSQLKLRSLLSLHCIDNGMHEISIDIVEVLRCVPNPSFISS